MVRCVEYRERENIDDAVQCSGAGSCWRFDKSAASERIQLMGPLTTAAPGQSALPRPVSMPCTTREKTSVLEFTIYRHCSMLFVF